MTEQRECDLCGRLLPVADDQTDPDPPEDEVILDAAGVTPARQNHYICGRCLADSQED